MNRETVERRAKQLEKTVDYPQSKPLRSDDAGLTKLYEALVAFVGQKTIDDYYQAYLDGDDSTLCVGLAYLRDCYEVREYCQRSPKVPEPEFDSCLILARAAWKRGSVRQKIVDAVRDLMDEYAADVVADNSSSQAAGILQPVALLTNWPEVCDALNRPNDDQFHGKLRRLNDSHKGPVKFKGKRGTHPMANRDELVKWWNGLSEDHAKQQQDDQQRDQDTDASVAVTYQHGKAGIVAPEIAGEIKSRKRSTKVHEDR